MPFTVEYTGYLLIGIIFFALMQTQRSNGMIYMELVYDRFGGRLRAWVDVLRFATSTCYGVIVTWYVFEYAENTCALGQISSYPSRTLLCYPQSIMVLGLVLLTLEWVRGGIRALAIALSPRPVSDDPQHTTTVL
ncbi:hypothetical protein JP75_20245 [Devosia riboflavina]|uniref:TRAP transporter small permease protein n=2 Tax=Devosia riboflavina TaxID=46914 RepID=A0A087LY67_9HYPH|nr:hypothetical protein JP75_20245 [Devosia riboflavina]